MSTFESLQLRNCVSVSYCRQRQLSEGAELLAARAGHTAPGASQSPREGAGSHRERTGLRWAQPCEGDGPRPRLQLQVQVRCAAPRPRGQQFVIDAWRACARTWCPEIARTGMASRRYTRRTLLRPGAAAEGWFRAFPRLHVAPWAPLS